MHTQQTAPTQYINANGTRLAYRRLGPSVGTPLILLVHFRGNMDTWDPALINRLAEDRPVILFDNAGVGRSGGEIPLTFAGWAVHGIALVQALKIKEVDVLGFSMGGCVAQMFALNAPAGMVRRAIFAGTRASKNDKLQFPDAQYFVYLSCSDEEHYAEAHAQAFFNNDIEGQNAARASWARIQKRNLKSSGEDHIGALSIENGTRQAEAFLQFMDEGATNTSFSRLHELKMPVLVVNGDNDLLVPTADSWNLAENINNAHLHIYPGSGHGFLYQHARLVAKHFNAFLNGEWDREETQSDSASKKDGKCMVS